MKRPFFLLIIACACLTPVIGRAEDPKPQGIKQQIEGEWVAVGGTSNGEPPPPGYLEKMSFQFKDGLYTFAYSEKEKTSPIKYTIDDTKTPAWIDLKNSIQQVGIIRIVDGRIHLCTGTEGERPTKFSTAPGTDQTFLILAPKPAPKKEASKIAPSKAAESAKP